MLFRLLKYIFLSLLIIFFLTLFTNVAVVFGTKGNIINNDSQIPEKYNLLVLGTSKHFASGSENLYYKNRMQATKALLDISDPAFVILSGSNPSEYYNEPEDMKLSLSELGLDQENYILDLKGNSTFESLKNYKSRFEIDSLVIITQEFHAYRTLLICKQLNINALVYPAEEVSADISNKPLIREVFARVKAVADFYLFDL